MKYRLLKQEEMRQWDALVHSSKMGVIYQTWDWGDIIMRGQNWTPAVLVAEEEGRIAAGALIAHKNIPFTGKRLVRVPRSLILADTAGTEALEFLIGAIEGFTKEVSGICCSFGLYLPDKINDETWAKYQHLNHTILAHKHITRTQPEEGGGTFWLDLTKSEKDLYKAFNSHNKRQIKKALKGGAQVKFRDDPALIDTFYEYYKNMFQRKGITPSSHRYFDQGVRRLIGNKTCRIFYAEHEGRILNFVIISMVGIPRYMWGASLPNERNLPPTGHLIHLEIIKHLKGLGFEKYDLGGSPGFRLKENHPNYGVWRFKKGLGGDYIDLFAGYELVLNKGLYRTYQKAFALYDKKRKG